MSSVSRSAAVAIGVIGLLCSSIASATPPVSVAGTWDIVGHQSPGSLRLDQGADATPCKSINGTIYPGTPDSGAVTGYYCPTTGRIVFVRKDATGTVNQIWIGNVSAAAAGQPIRMGGTFHAVAASGGTLGEYHFQGQR